MAQSCTNLNATRSNASASSTFIDGSYTPNETVGAGGGIDLPYGEEYTHQLENDADIVAVGGVAVESVQFCRLSKGTSVF